MSLLDELPKTRMPTLVTGPQHAEWRQLRDAWARALADNEKYSTDKTAELEVQTWDSWVDWVEENNLNYTNYDPRGRTDPSEEDDTQDWVRTLHVDDQIRLTATGLRWRVTGVGADGRSIQVFRRQSPLRFLNYTITGAKLVAAMKANTE